MTPTGERALPPCRPAPAAGGEPGRGAPEFGDLAWFREGRRQQAAGRTAAAAAAYLRALELRPEFPEALNNLGQLCLERGETDRARACFRQAARLAPEMPEPHFNLGELCRRQGALHAATAHYRRALARNPRAGEAWNNLGLALQAAGDPEGAAACHRRAVRLDPDRAETRYNLGGALRAAGDLAGAARELLAALRLKPRWPQAHNNLGLVWKAAGEPDLAAAAFSQALALDPDLAEARWNRSFYLLLRGRLREGWEDYEYRFAIPQWRRIYPFRLDLPRWDGGPAPGKTILVHDEQGFGDTLQFVRYLPWVRERCGRVVLESRPELMSLLEGAPGVDALACRPSGRPPKPDADLVVALMSLPRLCGTTLETIPAAVPYLRPDPERVRRWAERLAGRRPAIGIVWAGRPEHANDGNRSCRLERFLPLFARPGRRWIGLQKGPAAAQAEEAPFQGILANWGPQLADFADTAALVACLDLVIAVDTAVVHLAGALAKPVWVLLSALCDWRWMEARADSPWYPTMRLFRQERPGEWEPVFEKVGRELARLG
jgi:tetratricopeptide (TPR) repeat protein